MSLQKQERTQKTRPKKGEPIEIPVPKRQDVLRDLDKLTQPEKRPDKGRR
jgi:hypothetical protein